MSISHIFCECNIIKGIIITILTVTQPGSTEETPY